MPNYNITSTDPRKPAIVAALKRIGKGSKVTNVKVKGFNVHSGHQTFYGHVHAYDQSTGRYDRLGKFYVNSEDLPNLQDIVDGKSPQDNVQINLTSTSMVHTPGIFKWLGQVAKADATNATKILSEAYNINRTIAREILTGNRPVRITDDAISFEVSAAEHTDLYIHPAS